MMQSSTKNNYGFPQSALLHNPQLGQNTSTFLCVANSLVYARYTTITQVLNNNLISTQIKSELKRISLKSHSIRRPTLLNRNLHL